MSDRNDAYSQGRQDELLERHQARLDKLNGSLEKFATEMANHTLTLQQLRSDFVSSANVVVATALALEKAAAIARQTVEDRAAAAEKRWTPVQRWLGVLGGVIALVTLIILILTVTA